MTKKEAARESEFTLHAETLQGDLMKLVFDELKAMPQVWSRLSEDKQTEVIDRVGLRVAEAVKQTVQILAGRGRRTVKAKLDALRCAKDLKAMLICDRHDENRGALLDHVGATVLIVIADAGDFLDGGKDVKAEKDQPGLPGLQN